MGFLSWLFKASKKSEPAAITSDMTRYSVDVVGESHYQSSLSAICGGLTEVGHKKIVEATLILDDSNSYDDKAVKVEIDRMMVGYLSKENARAYRRRLKATDQVGFKSNCSAMIVGGWNSGDKGKGYFGLKLDIPAFEQHELDPDLTSKVFGNFSFEIEQVNIKEIARVRVGGVVNFWKRGGPTRVYPGDGQGDWLGLVPASYAKLIADHVSLDLPVDAKVMEKTDSSCKIDCKLVSPEVAADRKEQQDKLQDELNKSYRPRTKPRKPIAVDFSFIIEVPNVEHFDFISIGDPVNFWASVDEPTKIVVFRRGTIGGQGRLGLVPNSFSKLIADQRASSLPIETEVIEKAGSSCRVGCRLVPVEEVILQSKKRQDKFRVELRKKPPKPFEFSVYAKAHVFNVGEELKIARVPSIEEECRIGVDRLPLVMSSMDGARFVEISAEPAIEPAIKTRLLRIARTYNSLRITITSVSDAPLWRGFGKSVKEHSVRVLPVES